MIVPGAGRRVSHYPGWLTPFVLGIVAVFGTVIAWAIAAPSRVGNEHQAVVPPDISAVRSIAYTRPGPNYDSIVVQRADSSAPPTVLATFPGSGSLGYHARGNASPAGDRLAVLTLQQYSTSANLSIIDVATGVVRHGGLFDPLSRVAWSPDGTRVALTRSLPGPDPVVRVIEVDVSTLAERQVAEFPQAFAVAPVGYSFDGSAAYVVVVDQRGSNLYAERSGKVQLQAELSPGRTTDWALSPDSSRLGFVDVLGGGSRTYVGRTLLISTGAITTLPAEKNQLGTSWMPGSPVPAFGGPGGSWQLTDPDSDAAYLVPESWSPDGRMLVATVFSAGSDATSRPSTAIELLTRASGDEPSTRTRISDVPGASFFGWVLNRP